MKRSLIVALCIIGMLTNASAELRRKKNTATYVTFEIFNASTGALITGATGLDCERSGYDDGTNPPTYSDVNGTETEIGTTGTYYVALNAADTNFDFVSLQCKSTSTNAVTWTERINTKYGAVTTASDGSLGDSTIRGLSYSTGGTISAESGATLSLGTTTVITTNDQFNNGFRLQVYSASAGAPVASSCIVDTVQGAPDQVVLKEDISSFTAVSDLWDIVADQSCQMFNPATLKYGFPSSR